LPTDFLTAFNLLVRCRSRRDPKCLSFAVCTWSARGIGLFSESFHRGVWRKDSLELPGFI